MSKFSLKRFIGAMSSLAIASALLLGASAAPSQASPVVPVPNKVIDNKSVGIQMFMWNWVSLKSECTNHLGPNGIDWIQISPPQEHVVGTQWWVHYQPVSYKLESSLGTRQEFIDMVQACNTAGVQVIADAVINHMANGSGSGFDRSDYQKYTYPGIYASTDFHNGIPTNSARYCDGDIQNYDEVVETTSCELGSLPDLATEKPSVRQTIANYLNDLIDIGVAGFRVDAAKHLGVADLTAIVGMLHQVNGRQPYIASETIGDASINEPFTALGDVWAWDMVDEVNRAFSLDDANFAITRWNGGYSKTDKTITMVSNHDKEHHGETQMTYENVKRFLLAHEWMLAEPYGKPQLYTGYTFSDLNDGASGEGSATTGGIKDAVCQSSGGPASSYKLGRYVCLDRWKAIAGMIQWRDAANGLTTKYYKTDKRYPKLGHLVSYSLGTNAKNQTNFIVFNAGEKAIKATISTNMPRGVYCDVITGGKSAVKSNKTCLGTTVTVVTGGKANVTVPAYSSIAIHKLAKAK